jgi:hypothetical protein
MSLSGPRFRNENLMYPINLEGNEDEGMQFQKYIELVLALREPIQEHFICAA